MSHVSKSPREIARQMSSGSGQEYKTCSCKEKSDTVIVVSENLRTFYTVQQSKCHGCMLCKKKK